jgi:hypothetical protein
VLTIVTPTSRQRLDSEFYAARRMRVSSTVHPILNPRASAALAFVVDQIPRVKAELDQTDTPPTATA